MEIKSWETIPEEKLTQDITRQLIWGEKVMIARVVLEPNILVPTHEHESEQLTMAQKGAVTLTFPGGEEHTVRAGEMLVIPGGVPHSAKSGPEGCVVLDVFSPIRQDFIDGTAAYFTQGRAADSPEAEVLDDEAKYKRFQGILRGAGVKVEMDALKAMPLDLLARYVYEKECLSMGELRKIMGWDKKQAKDRLREWKHGDDHSESSLKRKMERLVIVPPTAPKTPQE